MIAFWRKGKRAFTIIELMIVVAIIAIIAAIAIPKLVMAKRSANEGAAIGNLETLSNSQTTLKMAKIVDQDGDDEGEFGLLGELSGEIIPRTASALLTATEAPVPQQFNTGGSGGTDGSMVRTGYVYRCWLAATDDGAGSITAGDDKSLGGTASAAGATLGDTDAINDQELYLVIYAWPEVAAKTGSRAFAMTENGNTFYSKMANKSYSGRGASGATNVPAANAIYTGTVFTSPLSSGTTVGNDTNQWKPSAG